MAARAPPATTTSGATSPKALLYNSSSSTTTSNAAITAGPTPYALSCTSPTLTVGTEPAHRTNGPDADLFRTVRILNPEGVQVTFIGVIARHSPRPQKTASKASAGSPWFEHSRRTNCTSNQGVCRAHRNRPRASWVEPESLSSGLRKLPLAERPVPEPPKPLKAPKPLRRKRVPTDQQCSVEGCTSVAAFRTRSKPTWCEEHIGELQRRGGIAPLEPFTHPKDWQLTECLTCTVRAHYRFEYTLDKNRLDEPTCRACYWRRWAAHQRALLGEWASAESMFYDEVKAFVGEHGFDYLGPLTAPSLRDDPHHTQCRRCGKISAETPGRHSFRLHLHTRLATGRRIARERRTLRLERLHSHPWLRQPLEAASKISNGAGTAPETGPTHDRPASPQPTVDFATACSTESTGPPKAASLSHPRKSRIILASPTTTRALDGVSVEPRCTELRRVMPTGHSARTELRNQLQRSALGRQCLTAGNLHHPRAGACIVRTEQSLV